MTPTPSRPPSRISIRLLTPASSGADKAKAIVGDPFVVEALVVCDGHDLLSAEVCWREHGAGQWQRGAMRAVGNDRWRGLVVAEAPGLVEVVVEAWTDRVGSWRRDITKWSDADLSAELAAGAALLAERATVLPPTAASRVLDAVSTLSSEDCSLTVRLNAGLDDAVAACFDAVPDPYDLSASDPITVRVERERAAVGVWYEMFPRSEGGFAGAAERLEDLAMAGVDVVYLPPIHPIGSTNRKGRYNTLVAGPEDPGSPWAIGSAVGGHEAVEPSIGGLDGFIEFRERAEVLEMEVALDLAFQCSPDHPWVAAHPEWFQRRPDGTIRYAENPPKKYQDIHPIDFWCELPHRGALWTACRDIVELWITRGVRIFRVDNPHTKPLPFWRWLIDDIWSRHPDVVFLAEAFTSPAMMHELARLGFSQSYTYFTWRTSAWELRSYVEELRDGSDAPWFRPNFWPSTPDILSGPLRGGSRQQFEIRLVLAALLAPSYGVYSGYELCENTPQGPDNEEYFDSEKYRIVTRDWAGSSGSLMPLFGRLNEIRRGHPAVKSLRNLRFVHVDDPNVLAWTLAGPSGAAPLLVVVNLSDQAVVETMVRFDPVAVGVDPAGYIAIDLLTNESWEWSGGDRYVRLDPDERVGHVLELQVPSATVPQP